MLYCSCDGGLRPTACTLASHFDSALLSAGDLCNQICQKSSEVCWACPALN